MTLTRRIHPEAALELSEAAEWYEAERTDLVILSVGSLGAVLGASISEWVTTRVGSAIRSQLMSLVGYGVLLGGYAFLPEGDPVLTTVIASIMDFGIGIAISNLCHQ